jgi:hypothetical protein
MQIEVAGHASSEGSAIMNQQLSLKRARSVVTYLVEAGVDAAQLQPVGYGASRPVAPNDGNENMAKNRRIEFTVRANPRQANYGQRPMDYLAYKLIWWLVAAFAVGLVIGWLSAAGGSATSRRDAVKDDTARSSAVLKSSMVALFVQTLPRMAAALSAQRLPLIRRSCSPGAPCLPHARSSRCRVVQRAPAVCPTQHPSRCRNPWHLRRNRPRSAAAAVAAAKAERAPAQDLKRIRLIDAGIEAALNWLGVDRYDISRGCGRGEAHRRGAGARQPHQPENGSAACLKGGETHFAARRGEASATPTPDERAPPIPGLTISPRPRPVGRGRGCRRRCGGRSFQFDLCPPCPYVPPDVSERAAFATRPAAAAAPAAVLPRTVPTAPLPPEPVPQRQPRPPWAPSRARHSQLGTEPCWSSPCRT